MNLPVNQLIELKEKGITLNGEIVGIKNLKIAGNWRIELDTYDSEKEQIKDMMDLLNRGVVIAIIPID